MKIMLTHDADEARIIFAGIGKGVSRVGLLLLQPVRAAIRTAIVQMIAKSAK